MNEASRHRAGQQPDASNNVLRMDPRSFSDSALVAAICAGDDLAKAVFFDRYITLVRGIVMRLLGCVSEVDDLAQDIFVAALQEMSGLKHRDALKPWLTSISVFTVRRHIRTKSRRRWLSFVAPAALPERAAPCAEPDTRQALALVYGILAELDVDDRMAFALRYIEGLELKEVADACDVSLATAKRRIKRAEEWLRRRAQTNPLLRDWLRPTTDEGET